MPALSSLWTAKCSLRLISFSTVQFEIKTYKKGGNEERDRRLQVVKLLTALSYRVGGSLICSVFQHLCYGMAFTVKGCVSAKKNWIMAVWVWVGGG